MVPTRLPPPSRFSMTTGWRSFSETLWPMVRASTSLPVPGEYGTTILMAWFG